MMKPLVFLMLIAFNAAYTAGQDSDFFDSIENGDSPTPYGLIHPSEHVVFRLFSRGHDDFEILDINRNSENQMAKSKSRFDPSKQTKVLIHGWMVHADEPRTAMIREAYLKHTDYNIITVDWPGLSRSFYTVARIAVQYVGEHIAEMLEYLVEHYGISLDDVHIIGHSLGGQVAGAAGAATSSGKVGRITGLDPAAPLFFNRTNRYRLDRINAKFVDVIHTSELGMSEAVGDADFYPNGGGPVQPGCPNTYGKDITLCSHRRAQVFFAESIGNKDSFPSIACNDFGTFMKGDCPRSSITVNMGEHASHETRGVYYLTTNADEPYSVSTQNK